MTVIALRPRPPMWDLLRQAIEERKTIKARYHGRDRLLCPHLLGWRNGRAKLVSYKHRHRPALPPPARTSDGDRCSSTNSRTSPSQTPPGSPLRTTPPTPSYRHHRSRRRPLTTNRLHARDLLRLTNLWVLELDPSSRLVRDAGPHRSTRDQTLLGRTAGQSVRDGWASSAVAIGAPVPPKSKAPVAGV
jgi:hypothetical protein